MTIELKDQSTLEDQLTAEVDKFLAEISHVTIVEASRVIDFALDIRKIVCRN